MNKVCKTCKRFVEGNVCPVCNSSNLTKNWKGSVVIFNSESEIAKNLGFNSKGKYAIWVKGAAAK